jgi:hypothetical protein
VLDYALTEIRRSASASAGIVQSGKHGAVGGNDSIVRALREREYLHHGAHSRKPVPWPPVSLQIYSLMIGRQTSGTQFAIEAVTLRVVDARTTGGDAQVFVAGGTEPRFKSCSQISDSVREGFTRFELE